MICPRCLYEQADSKECLKCGVVVDKFREANSHEFLQNENLPEVNLKIDPYKKVYKSDTKGKKVSSTFGRFVFVFVSLILLYCVMVFTNNYIIKKNMYSQINEALQTSLRYELNDKIILEEILEIGKKNKVEITNSNVIIKFTPDTKTKNNKSVNYLINISVPYRVNAFSQHFNTTVTVTLNDSMPDDGSLKVMRFKTALDID